MIPRDKKYLAFVKGHDCCVNRCHETQETIVPHHIVSGGKGIKCSDYKTISLCYKHHEELHRIGKLTFAEKYFIDYYREVSILLEEWITK